MTKTANSHGGRRPGSGRKKGSRDRATIEQGATLSELARKHTGTALKVLVEIASNSAASESARVAAANAILDRGYGKPAQHLKHAGDKDDDTAIKIARIEIVPISVGVNDDDED